METKKCNMCNEVKSLDSFFKRISGRPEYVCKCCSGIKRKARYDSNREKSLEMSKKYYNSHKPSTVVTRQKMDKEIVIANKKVYRTSEVAKKKRRAYRLKRIAEDPSYKIRASLKNRIYFALKGVAKSKSTLSLLGCDLSFFKKFLEEKFTGNMSWDNYGLFGWHIDHRIPCAAFDLTNKDEQKKCFHYTNMQPLWCTENILKSDKLT